MRLTAETFKELFGGDLVETPSGCLEPRIELSTVVELRPAGALPGAPPLRVALHRVSYAVHFNDPVGAVVTRICRNRRCCAPRHLDGSKLNPRQAGPVPLDLEGTPRLVGRSGRQLEDACRDLALKEPEGRSLGEPADCVLCGRETILRVEAAPMCTRCAVRADANEKARLYADGGDGQMDAAGPDDVLRLLREVRQGAPAELRDSDRRSGTGYTLEELLRVS